MNCFGLMADFGAGLFLCNAIPHLTSGLRGEVFPTPFAKPPGKGHSSAMVNTLWGTLNLAIGFLLWSKTAFSPGTNWHTLLFLIGFLAIGVYASIHFQSVRYAKEKEISKSQAG